MIEDSGVEEKAARTRASKFVMAIVMEANNIVNFAKSNAEVGLVVEHLAPGAGPLCPKGRTVLMHYTGTLDDGTVFDSSVSRKKAFKCKIGVGQVI